MYMKQCRTCGEYKAEDAFAWQKKHGYRGTGEGNYRLDCKDCVAAKAREYRKTYVPKGRKVRQDVDKVLYSAVQAKVTDARQRCSVGCVTTDFMYDLYHKQNGLCAVSGLQMSITKGDLGILSVDQKIPGQGYTEHNVQWVRWDVNRAKGELTMQQLVEMCRAIVRCNDYPAREYSQVAGSAQHPAG